MKSDRQLNIRVPGEVYDLLERKARKSGLSVSAWLALVALHAAGGCDLAEELARARDCIPPRKKS